MKSTSYPLRDALDRLDTATNMMALIQDLICCAVNRDITLSSNGASGLYTILDGCREASQDVSAAANPILKYQNEAPSSEAQEHARSQGYAQGRDDIVELMRTLDPDLTVAVEAALGAAASGMPVPNLTEPLSEAELGVKSIHA